MTPTKILFGQYLISCLLALLMLWTATQWTASVLNFSPRLGNPWLQFRDTPIYAPWKFFIWWYQFETYAPNVFLKGGAIAASGGMLGFAAAVAGSVLRARQPAEVTTYGSAKWASPRDIQQSDLTKNDGVFLGAWEQHYLRHDGPEHVMAFAPTRSGKGVGLVVPTLLSWGGSAVIHDIKGENWQLTAGWRSKYSRVLCFNPTDISSVRYNPLSSVRLGLNEVRDVQNIIDIMIDPQGSLQHRTHWDKTSNDLMVAVILHVLYAEPDKTMKGLARFLSEPSRSFDETLEILKSTNHLGDRPHPVVAQGAQQASNMSVNEFSGVLSTAMTLLGLYRDPIINHVTAECDFNIDELVSGEEPVSLYLVIPPSDISRTRPLIRLLLNQILRRLTEKLEAGKKDRHRLLLMLDEFPALGRLDFFETSLGFIAGYGIKAYLIAQSLNQIDKAYGPNNAIVDNCHVRVAFATNDERTAKRISEMLGTCTEQRAQRNYAGHRLAPWLGHVMVSSQETSRHLLTPGEVMQLPTEESLVMRAGSRPIRANKLRYYEDRNFIGRILPPPVATGGETVTASTIYSDCPTSAPTAPLGRECVPNRQFTLQRSPTPNRTTGDQDSAEATTNEKRNKARDLEFISRVGDEFQPDLGGSLG